MAYGLADGVPPEDILVIYTDEGEPPRGPFPWGPRGRLASLVADLEPDDAQFVLVALLRSFGADAIVNVNSRLLYHALRVYGRALAASERLFLVFFCNEQTALGSGMAGASATSTGLFDYVAGSSPTARRWPTTCATPIGSPTRRWSASTCSRPRAQSHRISGNVGVVPEPGLVRE
ncbi:MAG: hypothetical protein U0R78_07775 [Nocardioidaceae bacterium]